MSLMPKLNPYNKYRICIKVNYLVKFGQFRINLNDEKNPRVLNSFLFLISHTRWDK